jgi:molybdopterin-guanine dinucleotide biosynthesis protein MobB/phenylacetic acid degradation protein PaaD
MQDKILNFFKKDKFAAVNGIELIEVKPGYAAAEMKITDKHLNAAGIVQGGAIFTLADFAFASASNSYGTITLGVNANISYFNPAKGKILTAEAQEVNAGSKLSNYCVDIFDENEVHIARFNALGYRKKDKIDFEEQSIKSKIKGIPVVCFVAGSSGTGKTTFLEKLIKVLDNRGYNIGFIKSDAHRIELDKPGKDTWKMTQAGAKAAAIISSEKFAVIQQTGNRKKLKDVAGIIENVDLIIAEGFKREKHPYKIELVRKEKGTKIVTESDELLAVITDVEELEVSVPKFELNDVAGVADFLEKNFF